MTLTLEDRWPHIERIERLNPLEMNPEFVDVLDEFARALEKPIVINQGASLGGHNPRSKHYDRPAMAVDFYVKDIDLDDLFFLAVNFKSHKGLTFNGIGAYPFWNTPGLHVDAREKPVYWYRDEQKKYHYSIQAVEIEEKLTEITRLQQAQIDFCCAEF